MDTSWSEVSDDNLVNAMLAHNEPSWEEFRRRFDRLIFRCIHNVIGRFGRFVTYEDAREIHAGLLLSLMSRDMHKLRVFSTDRGTKLGTWIGMLATHAAWDYLRRVARTPRSAELDERMPSTDDPHATLESAEHLRDLSSEIADLSQKDRTLVQLHFVEGLEPEEVAERMQISVKTVYTKKHKIRARLETRARTAKAA